MLEQSFSLNIDYAAMGISQPEQLPTFTGRIPGVGDGFCLEPRRPAVIICPGGGYYFTADREATPIAISYLAAGISTFVLRYSVAPNVFPTALVELATAVKLVRSHADEWGIDPQKIVVAGFSAGGHLAASLGVFWNSPVLRERGFSDDLHKPNGMVLSYPVISGINHPHMGSFQNLLGSETPTEEQLLTVSLEKQVTADTPPTFLWHTVTDPAVPVQNSLSFATALAAHGVPTEMHLYPTGGHGLALADDAVCLPDDINPKAQTWMKFSIDWVKNL